MLRIVYSLIDLRIILLLLAQQFLLIASMNSQLEHEDSFSSLKEGEYRLFNPCMFKDLNTSTQADPQQGDTYQFYEIEQDYDNKKSNNESIIDRFNTWDQPLNRQNQELKSNNSRIQTYTKEQSGKMEIEDSPCQLINQKQSQVSQRNYANYAEPEAMKRKCSNPKFLGSPITEQKEQLIRNLELHSLERQKYSESPYFSKKQRRVEEKEIQQIFDQYNALSTHNYQQKLKAQESQKLQHSYRTQIQKPEKTCKFCVVSKMKLHKQQTQLEAMASKVNFSPARSLHQKYLHEEDKTHLQPREEYLQEGRLKAEYMKSVGQSIERELKKLKQWKGGSIKSNFNSSTPRKKIFDQHPSLQKQEYIKIQDDIGKFQKINIFTPQTQKAVKSKRNDVYRNIFASPQDKKLVQTNKKNKKSNSVDFDYVSTPIVSSRMKIFNNSTWKSGNPPTIVQKTLSPKRLFSSPMKENAVGIFIQMDMNNVVRKWFAENKLSISVQTEKILSYQLIKRYLAKEEIEQRLRLLVHKMVKPKQWLLTLVDEVYSRLKDRYFPS